MKHLINLITYKTYYIPNVNNLVKNNLSYSKQILIKKIGNKYKLSYLLPISIHNKISPKTYLLLSTIVNHFNLNISTVFRTFTKKMNSFMTFMFSPLKRNSFIFTLLFFFQMNAFTFIKSFI